MDDAFKYVTDFGSESQASYPYKGWMAMKCQYDASKTVLKPQQLSGYVDVKSRDGQALENAVAKRVVSIAIDATDLQYYTGGIIKQYNYEENNHGVAIVGYGVEGSTPFYRVRNSWGASFGEDGYFRILKNTSDKTQGIMGELLDASYPLLSL